ncbi:hypothetical protein KR52_02300 [Synechococcus sp. KORDI-52]|uniref:hypothetical protein n=1 Tax=Synechococcus sp. KORDI-52 TaxID=585425 RepID=UPI0004E0ACC0|nr:hypothetical protein [Synechococcus sp. KORDI-52]AII47991.1 hypothetical protein KR52_02300 [Synechococcus sp. KORDI-52]
MESRGPIAVLRLLLLGCLLVGLASGLRYGWIELHPSRFLKDVGVPVPEEGKGIDFNRWLIEGGSGGQAD